MSATLNIDFIRLIWTSRLGIIWNYFTLADAKPFKMCRAITTWKNWPFWEDLAPIRQFPICMNNPLDKQIKIKLPQGIY